MSIVALIPARAGSKRIPGKNVKDFFGKPLMAYTIETALESGVFKEIYVSSDSDDYLDIAVSYGAKPIKRAEQYATDLSCDQEWIKHALLRGTTSADHYAVLRPTNPFRTAGTIKTAILIYNRFKNLQLKSMELCKQHPYKMWRDNVEDKKTGYHVDSLFGSYMHNLTTQQFYDMYIQNGCIYVSKTDKYQWENTVIPYITTGYEGFDINTEDDWILAEELVKRGKVKL